MTRKRIIECDGVSEGCIGSTEIGSGGELPSGWGRAIVADGPTVHLCPSCALRAGEWATRQRSAGNEYVAKHTGIGPGTGAETVTVVPSEERSFPSVWVTDVNLATDSGRYPDPAFNNVDSADRAIHVHVDDSAGLTVVPTHKDEPNYVVFEPGEHATNYELREQGTGQRFDGIYAEGGLDITHNLSSGGDS